MPTITFSYVDLCSLVGQKLKPEQFEYLLSTAKAELEDQLTTETTVSFNDTNLPYLWSPEGLARHIRTYLGRKHPRLTIKKSKDRVVYDKRLKNVRPYIACFTATGKRIDEYLIKQLIQLQEKLTENYGKKREKISIGVYPLNKITFPVHCRAAKPSERFAPLDFDKPATLKTILETHPKGKEYGHLIKDSPVYPVFSDANNNILSLIPVINSEQTGRLQEGDDALFFDTTGTDEDDVNLVANIFALALAERGFTINQLTIAYPNKNATTPSLKANTLNIKHADIKHVLGLDLKPTQIKTALHKMGHQYKNGTVTIPPYRNDIMHPVDIIEDIAIGHGYEKFTPLPLATYTPGMATPIQHFINTHRELWTGQGYQETMSPILSNKDLLYKHMNMRDFGTVEITNYTSQTYSCIRTWILPLLLSALAKNRHVDHPHLLFEQGLVSVRKPQPTDEHHLAAVTSHANATFTELRQAIEATLRNTNTPYTIEEYDANCFIPGRAAQVKVRKNVIGFFGELHPAILENFGINMPTAGGELNLSALYDTTSRP